MKKTSPMAEINPAISHSLFSLLTSIILFCGYDANDDLDNLGTMFVYNRGL